jgi:hypothetical protein
LTGAPPSHALPGTANVATPAGNPGTSGTPGAAAHPLAATTNEANSTQSRGRESASERDSKKVTHRSARDKPAEASSWKAVPMPPPKRRILSKLTGEHDDRARRAKMLRNGPPYRNVAAAKRALARGQLDEQTYLDNIWTLKQWRHHMRKQTSEEWKRGALSEPEYTRRLKLIEKRYEGR